MTKKIMKRGFGTNINILLVSFIILMVFGGLVGGILGHIYMRGTNAGGLREGPIVTIGLLGTGGIPGGIKSGMSQIFYVIIISMIIHIMMIINIYRKYISRRSSKYCKNYGRKFINDEYSERDYDNDDSNDGQDNNDYNNAHNNEGHDHNDNNNHDPNNYDGHDPNDNNGHNPNDDGNNNNGNNNNGNNNNGNNNNGNNNNGNNNNGNNNNGNNNNGNNNKDENLKIHAGRSLTIDGVDYTSAAKEFPEDMLEIARALDCVDQLSYEQLVEDWEEARSYTGQTSANERMNKFVLRYYTRFCLSVKIDKPFPVTPDGFVLFLEYCGYRYHLCISTIEDIIFYGVVRLNKLHCHRDIGDEARRLGRAKIRAMLQDPNVKQTYRESHPLMVHTWQYLVLTYKEQPPNYWETVSYYSVALSTALRANSMLDIRFEDLYYLRKYEDEKVFLCFRVRSVKGHQNTAREYRNIGGYLDKAPLCDPIYALAKYLYARYHLGLEELVRHNMFLRQRAAADVRPKHRDNWPNMDAKIWDSSESAMTSRLKTMMKACGFTDTSGWGTHSARSGWMCQFITNAMNKRVEISNVLEEACVAGGWEKRAYVYEAYIKKEVRRNIIQSSMVGLGVKPHERNFLEPVSLFETRVKELRRAVEDENLIRLDVKEKSGPSIRNLRTIRNQVLSHLRFMMGNERMRDNHRRNCWRSCLIFFYGIQHPENKKNLTRDEQVKVASKEMADFVYYKPHQIDLLVDTLRGHLDSEKKSILNKESSSGYKTLPMNGWTRKVHVPNEKDILGSLNSPLFDRDEESSYDSDYSSSSDETSWESESSLRRVTRSRSMLQVTSEKKKHRASHSHKSRKRSHNHERETDYLPWYDDINHIDLVSGRLRKIDKFKDLTEPKMSALDDNKKDNEEERIESASEPVIPEPEPERIILEPQRIIPEPEIIESASEPEIIEAEPVKPEPVSDRTLPVPDQTEQSTTKPISPINPNLIHPTLISKPKPKPKTNLNTRRPLFRSPIIIDGDTSFDQSLLFPKRVKSNEVESYPSSDSTDTKKKRKPKKKRERNNDMSSAYKGLSVERKKRRTSGISPEMSISATLRPRPQPLDLESSSSDNSATRWTKHRRLFGDAFDDDYLSFPFNLGNGKH